MINRRSFSIFISCCLSLSLLILTFPSKSFEQRPSSPYPFQEIWGYVMKGEETYLSNTMPLTDIGYFAAQINEQGRLPSDINRPDLTGEFDQPVRIHLVVSAPWNKTIMNFCLRSDMPLRQQILDDIVTVAPRFDGVQIDFESLNWEDKEAYMSFLRELKSRLPGNITLSAAVPARWWTKDNPFDYQEISGIVDRVIVMAYDEHWRTGEAGPIASLPWCKKVLDFSRQHIADEKLVMGLPLYGRAWQKEQLARALKYDQTVALCSEKQCAIRLADDGSPYFEFQEKVNIAVHFENLNSLISKLDTYHHNAVNRVAFWRLGQEPDGLWKNLTLK